MADENSQSAQGTISPTFFIGLGGVGSRIVDRIAARARSLPNWTEQLEPLTAFVSIDTNDLDQDALRVIPRGNRINIASFDKQKVVQDLRRSEDPQASQWLPGNYTPRAGKKPGAGQIRIESRLGFFFHSATIKQRLELLFQHLLAPNVTWRKEGKVNVYLFCTLAGGTGSGSFLSAAYLIDDIVRRRGWQPRLISSLLLSTLVTDKVGPELHVDIHANTYAALKELENLNKLDYAQVKQAGRTSEPFQFLHNNTREVLTVDSRPFFINFIVDRPQHIGPRKADEVLADAAFLQVFTPIINELAGEYDNYEKNLESLTRFPGRLGDVGEGYSKNFGAYGAVALTVPGHDLLEYSALRFAAQALRAQITFGVDQSDAKDSRARALAKLAVDYGSPRFKSLSDAGREEVINTSFVESVRELARQDDNDGLTEGYWFKLVELSDHGRITGEDEHGAPTRDESLLDKVRRRLEGPRTVMINRIEIKDRPTFFPRQQVETWIQMVASLENEARAGHKLVDAQIPALEMSASEGEPVVELRLDPIQERYLVVRLLDVCVNEWIPAAEQAEKAAAEQDIVKSSAKLEALRHEELSQLQRAAKSGPPWNRDRDFNPAKEQAQEAYTSAKTGCLRYLSARVELAQLRALREYLQMRSRQYVHLATRMDGLVRDLEHAAERLRKGETSVVAPYALQVEVFETMEEPRERLWSTAYSRLFLEGGRYVSTFDRQVLAEAITEQLLPEMDRQNRPVAKSVERTVDDLHKTMVQLGRDRLRARIFGGEGESGLDIISALDIEAEIVLARGRPDGYLPDAEAVAAYRKRKFIALGQLAGVMAQVSTTEYRALDDGVTDPNRTRLMILGMDTSAMGQGAQEFKIQLADVLSYGGHQVKEPSSHWYDPRTIIVHDVVLPVPLYYFNAVVGDLEDAYLKQVENERRGYRLHTDTNWEDPLPNLNPERGELAAGWAIKTFAKGQMTRVIGMDRMTNPERTSFFWRRDRVPIEGIDEKLTTGAPGDKPYELGSSFAPALAKLGMIHDDDDLRTGLEKQINAIYAAMTVEAREQRREELIGLLSADVKNTALLRTDGKEVSGYAYLDGPIKRALKRELEEMPVHEQEQQHAVDDDLRYH